MQPDYGYFEEKQLGKPYDIKMLGKLYPFVRPYRRFLAGSVLLVIFIALMDLALPYVTKIAIDRYIIPEAGISRSEVSTRTAGDEENVRYFNVELSDPENAEIVARYQHLFETTGQTARIHFKDLSLIDSRELSLLRKNDLGGIGFVSIVFILIILVNFVLTFIQVMVMEYTGQMIMHDLRVRLFKHIQNLSVAFHTRNPVGRLVTRVTNDVQNMHELFTSILAFLFKDLFLLIGIMLVLLTIDWRLAMISLVSLPIVVIAALYFSRQSRNVFRTMRIKIAEINTQLSETIGGIKVIQLFLQERENYRGFKRLNHQYYRAGIKQVHVFAVFMPVIELMGSVALAVVIFYGGGEVVSQNISIGALVAFISYLKMFFRPIRDIAEKYNIMQNAMASSERIFLILDNNENKPGPVNPVQYDEDLIPKGGLEPATDLSGPIRKLVMENVSFGYLPNETVLEEVSFAIHSGETLAVVGPTGSGKTSMINLIERFYDPVLGRILINGRNIKDITIASLRSKMSLVMQDPFLFSGTIRDNIAWSRKNISNEEMGRILDESNCRQIIKRLPDGLDTVLSESGGSISSGERQLISIARAFAHDPELIILDEATSYIDSETEQKIKEALNSLMKGRMAIIVAHRLSTTKDADNILVLNRGRIIEKGSHADLMNVEGFYYRLNQLQG
jgi:ATP-binding cassette subfamily B multidrug efflux pump